LVLGLAGLAISASIALVASCNVHELAHALVGSMLGWDVERVNLCLGGGGSVQYSSIGSWAGNAQGYAGGFVAAAFLAALYYLMFERSRRPWHSPAWWGAGLGGVLWIGPQLVIGVLEGNSAPGEDYTALIASSPVRYIGIIALSVVAATAVYTWRWRSPRRADT
jgi:hypothetical protein